jgi:peptide/nickel transport system ATP-binding protein
MPRQLSGGQKQRIGVARAFAGNARVVVADEPVSALDVSVQAAVTELLMDVQRQNKTTMLFISHDLSVVRYLADRVVVMYLGYIVEQGTTDQIFAPPYHPYTEALLSAIPIADTSVVKKHIVLDGDIPSAMNPPSGCPFQTRCRWKSRVPDNLCETRVPPLKNLGNGHQSLCWLDDAELGSMEPVISFAQPNAEAPAVVAPVAAPTIEAAPAAAPGADRTPVEHVAPLAEKGAKPAARSAVAGESSPKRRAAEAGSGRQAVNPRVKPGTTAAKTKAPSAAKANRAGTSVEAEEPAHPYIEAAPALALSPHDRNRPAGMPRPEQPDDLKLISGIGPRIEATLNGLGIYTYAQIASWKKAEREWVDGFLKFKGRIDRDDWVKQAKALKKGGVEEYVRVFGKKPR